MARRTPRTKAILSALGRTSGKPRRSQGRTSGALLKAFGILLPPTARERAVRAQKGAEASQKPSRQKRAPSVKLRATPADRLMRLLRDNGLGDFKTEHPFAKAIGRRWRFDISWPSHLVAVEIEGGIFGKGGKDGDKPCELCGEKPKGAHGSTSGILRDIEKYNAGTMLGWRIYRVPTNAINLDTVEAIRRLLTAARYTKTGKPLRIVATPRRL